MDIPWVDKYRPSKLDYVVHQPELMKTLKNIIKTGEMPHLLFHGSPGTGKTTTILALSNELFG
jgi:replication factor C subunit 2/4